MCTYIRERQLYIPSPVRPLFTGQLQQGRHCRVLQGTVRSVSWCGVTTYTTGTSNGIPWFRCSKRWWHILTGSVCVCYLCVHVCLWLKPGRPGGINGVHTRPCGYCCTGGAEADVTFATVVGNAGRSWGAGSILPVIIIVIIVSADTVVVVAVADIVVVSVEIVVVSVDIVIAVINGVVGTNIRDFAAIPSERE